MKPAETPAAAPLCVTFRGTAHPVSNYVSGITYGELHNELEQVRATSEADGFARGDQFGFNRAHNDFMNQTNRQQTLILASGKKTQNKLSKQTSILGLGVAVATLALGTAAINQVPTLVALTSCGVKAGAITDQGARDATLHDCRVAGHIAIAVTALASTGAILAIIIASLTFCSRSR